MKLWIILIVFVFGVLIGLVVKDLVISGRTIEEISSEYKWTRAICNSENECIDVIIHCKNGKIINIEPILYMIKHSEDWEDLRENFSESFC